jgi:hypothetical protein
MQLKQNPESLTPLTTATTLYCVLACILHDVPDDGHMMTETFCTDIMTISGVGWCA